MSLIRKNDTVEVITGPYKGRRGKVLEVDRKGDRVLVEGVNFRKRHEPVRQTDKGTTGGIIEQEAAIHISNVQVVDPKTEKPVRLGIKVEADGTRRRVTRGRNGGSVLE